MIALGIALPSRGRMVDGHVERTDVLVSGAELSMLLSLNSLYAQGALEPNQPTPPAPQVAGNIHGVVKAGNMPIPGAGVSISLRLLPTQKISTWSDVDGSYTAAVPSFGSYIVRCPNGSVCRTAHNMS